MIKKTLWRSVKGRVKMLLGREHGTLYTVASPARSGTMWYSQLLTAGPSFCFHELTTHLLLYPSNLGMDEWFAEHVVDGGSELSQRRWFLQCYPQYFSRLWERAIYGQTLFGNSDHLFLGFLPGLWGLWPAMRFVFSARNGINVVQSRLIFQAKTPESVINNWRHRFGVQDFFGLCCHAWVSEVAKWKQSRDRLAGRAQIIETRLEAVTRDPAELRRVWDWIGIGNWKAYEERNLSLMHTPANARMNRDRTFSPEEIWSGWGADQRRTFRRICGKSMRVLGYQLPKP